jgi:hypothetical protein
MSNNIGTNETGTSNLPFDNEVDLIFAHTQLGLAFEILQDTAQVHPVHPHVWEAINNAVNAGAALAAKAFEVTGFTEDAALAANTIAQNQAEEILSELRATGVAH